MNRIRIFLVTYRRPQLLRRALGSLLAQTFTDWICELHNDAPEDDAPRTILAELARGDPRFSYHQHEHNWGAVAAFNHAYAGGPEPFAGLLEDDNWWEPDFLTVTLRALAAKPDAALAWANMALWQEQPAGHWTDTGRTIWRCAPAVPSVVEFCGPEMLQAFDALHSNGAMIFRPDRFRMPGVPPSTPFAIIEQLRERAAGGPLLLITSPLANFACTLGTARDGDPMRWLQAKLLIAASFFQVLPVSDRSLQEIWAARRDQRPRDTGFFFCLALALRDPRLIGPARFSDWLHFFLSVARHPIRLARGLRFRHDHPEVWSWLCTQTASGRKTVRTTICTKQI